ncbi:MAG: hypothetical protein RI958_14 [Actinomycetota bacterium]|jgi:hypothetical protein
MKTPRFTVAVVAVLTVGSTFLAGCGSDSGGGGDCSGGVFLLGRVYDVENFNDGVLEAADLGPVLGVVQRNVACPGRDGEAGEVPVGTELRTIQGIDPGIGFAAEIDGRVRVFRSYNPPTDLAIEQLLPLDDVIEIGLNSTHDGDTRWATIDDPGQIAAILDAARTAPIVESSFEDALRPGLKTVFEIVRSDGLRTRTVYTIDRRLLSDRRVDRSGWTARELPGSVAAIIDTALDAAPQPRPRDGLELVGRSGTADVLDPAACRLDRPQLSAVAEDRLLIGGSRSGGITFAIISGPGIEGYAVDDEAIGDGIPLPDTVGPVLIELWSMNLGTSFCSVIDVEGPP